MTNNSRTIISDIYDPSHGRNKRAEQPGKITVHFNIFQINMTAVVPWSSHGCLGRGKPVIRGPHLVPDKGGHCQKVVHFNLKIAKDESHKNNLFSKIAQQCFRMMGVSLPTDGSGAVRVQNHTISKDKMLPESHNGKWAWFLDRRSSLSEIPAIQNAVCHRH